MTNPEEQKAAAEEAEATEHHQEVIVDQDEPETEAEAPAEDKAVSDMTPEEARAAAEQAREEAMKFRDMALRAEAEMENLRRRTEREVEHAVKFGAEKLVQNLLPVVDSLEKAIESTQQVEASDATKAIIEGMGLCQKMFLDILGKEGVQVVDPHGEPFDPNLHQAMSMVENPDVEPNTVVVVVQKGFQLNGRLVRPAMVMVSKGVSPKIDETA
ncbi:MAG: nucleotide exchange factor GrpE [Pseudomonadales bacterium]|nr:nucleotide exchange factor GrpE [Pseudomonadales bacterium]